MHEPLLQALFALQEWARENPSRAYQLAIGTVLALTFVTLVGRDVFRWYVQRCFLKIKLNDPEWDLMAKLLLQTNSFTSELVRQVRSVTPLNGGTEDWRTRTLALEARFQELENHQTDVQREYEARIRQMTNRDLNLLLTLAKHKGGGLNIQATSEEEAEDLRKALGMSATVTVRPPSDNSMWSKLTEEDEGATCQILNQSTPNQR